MDKILWICKNCHCTMSVREGGSPRRECCDSPDWREASACGELKQAIANYREVRGRFDMIQLHEGNYDRPCPNPGLQAAWSGIQEEHRAAGARLDAARAK